MKPYYADATVTLWHGDCRDLIGSEIMPADLILADPCILGYVIDKTKPRGKRNSPCPECNPPSNIVQFGRRRA